MDQGQIVYATEDEFGVFSFKLTQTDISQEWGCVCSNL